MSIKNSIKKVHCLKYSMIESNSMFNYFKRTAYNANEYVVPSLNIAFNKVYTPTGAGIEIKTIDTIKPRSVFSKSVSFPKDFIDDIVLANNHRNKYNFYMEKIISSDSWTNNEELS